MIVPKDHVKAKEVLKLKSNQTAAAASTSNADKERESAARQVPETEIDEASDLYLSENTSENMSPLEVIPPLSPLEVTPPPETSHPPINLQEEDHVSVASASTASAASDAMLQSTLGNFFRKSPSGNIEEDNVGKLQKDISTILVKLEELKLSNAQGKKSCESEESLDIAGIKAAKNLLELCGEKQLKITFLDDGCCITCLPCNEFVKANPFMKM